MQFDGKSLSFGPPCFMEPSVLLCLASELPLITILQRRMTNWTAAARSKIKHEWLCVAELQFEVFLKEVYVPVFCCYLPFSFHTVLRCVCLCGKGHCVEVKTCAVLNPASRCHCWLTTNPLASGGAFVWITQTVFQQMVLIITARIIFILLCCSL